MIHAISVFSIKFTMEFTSYAMKFFTEESKESDLIIKAATPGGGGTLGISGWGCAAGTLESLAYTRAT